MQSPLVDRYLDGFRALREATAGVSREQQLLRPVPGRWSILEVVCHLSDMELVFTDRMKRVIAEDRPTFFDADPDVFAHGLAYHERSLPEELTLIELSRRQMARILGSLPAEALTRTGTHSTAGPLTLEQLLTKVTDHLNHHVQFILEKRQALNLA